MFLIVISEMKGWEETDFSIHIGVAFRDTVRLLDGLLSRYYYTYFVVKMQMMRKERYSEITRWIVISVLLYILCC